jgi:hypothetical protein
VGSAVVGSGVGLGLATVVAGLQVLDPLLLTPCRLRRRRALGALLDFGTFDLQLLKGALLFLGPLVLIVLGPLVFPFNYQRKTITR